jgi:very-short-patch-repair endonuclease
MARVLDPTKMAYAAELYASGKTFKEVAAELGMDPEGLREALHRRGVKAHPRRGGHNRLPIPDGIAAVYLAGTSEKGLAEQFGVSRPTMRRWLIGVGVQRRSMKDATALHLAQMSAEERSRKAAAAHAARRGVSNTEEHQCRIAAGKERVGYGGRTSPGTDFICEELTRRGIEHTREKAVGRYNLDIALAAAPVAVEVLGGLWHGAKPIHARRTPYILDKGWNVVFVWNTKRVQVGPEAVHYVVAFAEETRRHPTPVRQYRVIRGDGKVVATGQADDDEFPLVPPSEAALD